MLKFMFDYQSNENRAFRFFFGTPGIVIMSFLSPGSRQVKRSSLTRGGAGPVVEYDIVQGDVTHEIWPSLSFKDNLEQIKEIFYIH